MLLSTWLRTVVVTVTLYGLGYLHGTGRLRQIWRLLRVLLKRLRKNPRPKQRLQPIVEEEPSDTTEEHLDQLPKRTNVESVVTSPSTVQPVEEPLPTEAVFILKNAMRIMEIFVPWVIYRFGPLLDGAAVAAHSEPSPLPPQSRQIRRRHASEILSITDVSPGASLRPAASVTSNLGLNV